MFDMFLWAVVIYCVVNASAFVFSKHLPVNGALNLFCVTTLLLFASAIYESHLEYSAKMQKCIDAGGTKYDHHNLGCIKVLENGDIRPIKLKDI